MSANGRTLANVDLNLLKAMDALLQERSVTRAAERLGVTQPSMSASLRRLRDLMDDDILVREGAGMRPTAMAEALQPTLHRIVEEIAAIVTPAPAFEPARDAASFSILATDYSALILLQPWLAILAEQAPGVRVDVRSISPADHVDALGRGDVDLAIVPSRFSRQTTLSKQPLLSDRFVAVTWAGNDEVGEELTMADLERLPYLSYRLGPIRSMVDGLLDELDHGRDPTVQVQGFVMGALMLRGTSLVTFLQQRLVDRLAEAAELRALRSPFPSPTVTEMLTWHPRDDHRPDHQWVRATLLDFARQSFGPTR
jgi:DNA-binding transcriptional LysR family regulator